MELPVAKSALGAYLNMQMSLSRTAMAHLIIPAHNELQVAHKLPEGFVVREELLCAAWDIFLLLEVQILDLSQDCHQLKAREEQGTVIGR